jgi:hypothetical protein
LRLDDSEIVRREYPDESGVATRISLYGDGNEKASA